jgi:hypothetical protein
MSEDWRALLQDQIRRLADAGRGEEAAKAAISFQQLSDLADAAELRAIATDEERVAAYVSEGRIPFICLICGHAFRGGEVLLPVASYSILTDQVVTDPPSWVHLSCTMGERPPR